MQKEEMLKCLDEWEFKISAYDLLLSTAYFDDETIAPSDGKDYRYDRFAAIASENHTLRTDQKMKEILDALSKEDLDSKDKRRVELLSKDFKEMEKIPFDVYENYTKLTLESASKWHEAKNNDDYKIFEPYLKKVITAKRELALYRYPDQDVYDTLLGDFEMGMTKAKYDPFFDLIKKELLPLIEKVKEAKAIDDSFIFKFYDKERQVPLMAKLNDLLGFDKSWGYMGVSMHPFTSGLSSNDVRVTTFYDEYNIASAIYSIVHEDGHAFYEHQMDRNFDGTILKAVSSGMHESQSRLLENCIGRRKSFIKNYYPYLRSLYPEILKDVSLEDFYKAVNASKPSFIRTDADELTYPIHILIRYELEKGLYDGTITSDDLDKKWADMYEKYLGIRPQSAKLGILQDIHWSDGSFGYFPTYALGSAVSAQIMHHLAKDMDIDTVLENGDIQKITDWLRDNFQKYGYLYDLDDLLKVTFDEGFDPHYYIDYLKDKYTKLYNL